MDDLKEFKNKIKKVSKKRKHKVTNSIGVYDAYKWIRKNKWFNIGKNLTEKDFYKIIRAVNNKIAEELIKGNSIKLPHQMGLLEIRKYEASIKMVKGKLVTNLPIDWDRTLKLWYEDIESYKNKKLIKSEESEIFKVLYNKTNAKYINKSYYLFKVNRDIKQGLKYNIKKGYIDAFKIK